MRVSNLISLSAAVALTAAAVISTARAAEPDPAAIVDTYGDIALAMYEGCAQHREGVAGRGQRVHRRSDG